MNKYPYFITDYFDRQVIQQIMQKKSPATPATPSIYGVNDMDYEHEFFIFLLENYACAKNRPTGDVLREWDAHGITQEIFDGFFIYHQEALTNAYMDIDSLLATGEHAY